MSGSVPDPCWLTSGNAGQGKTQHRVLPGRCSAGRPGRRRPPAAAAGQLHERSRSTGHDVRNLAVRDRDHVMQDERRSLGGREGVQGRHLGEPDVACQERRVLRTASVLAGTPGISAQI